MALNTLHANHIGGQGGNHEPQRTNNALLHIVGLQSGSAGGGANDDVLTLALMSFPIPKVNNGVIEVPYLNEKRKFAGNPTYDDLSVVFKDYVDRPVAQTLWKWRYQVHDPETGRTGLASAYKKSGWVSLYGPDGQVERQYDLIGIWPSAMDPGDIDMGGEDTVNITVTFTIDKSIPGTGLRPSGNA